VHPKCFKGSANSKNLAVTKGSSSATNMRKPLCQSILWTSRRVRARTFTSTAQTKFILDGPIELAAQLIRSIHDLSGLTYGITIPLTAIALRTVVTLPLSIYSQRKLIRRAEIRPLHFFWGELIGITAMNEVKRRSRDVSPVDDKSTHEMAKPIWAKAVSLEPFVVNLSSCPKE